MALIGENASGKTTFLKEIIQENPNLLCNPQAKNCLFRPRIEWIKPNEIPIRKHLEN